MSFSFLNPLFWLGALAVAAPIWLHLRRKQPRHLIKFSTLRFLEDQPLAAASPLWLRDWLLFLLRALALLALVAAFAWPFRQDELPPVIQESRIYLLDNTLSHQAGGGFARDSDRLLAEIASAGVAVQVAVIEVAAQPRVLVPFSDDRDTAREKVRDLAPSFQRGSYLHGFRVADSLLANALGQHRRIVLLGDNQESQWADLGAAPPFLKAADIELPRLAATNAPNLWLYEPRAQRIFLGEQSLVNFTVKLARMGSARSARVRLVAEGRVITEQEVALEADVGSTLLQAQWEASPASWVRGEVTVSGAPDELAGDNRVYFALEPVREGRVAVLAASPYLRAALSPEVMRGQWAARWLEPAALAAELASGDEPDVLIIESQYLPAAEARKLLWRQLSNGRGALVLVNHATPAVTGALRELGIETGTTQSHPRGEKFAFIFHQHPVFHPFLSPDYGNLLEVTVERYTRLKAAHGYALLYSAAGDALMLQGTRTPGRLFVTAFGLDRRHTSWPVHPTFIPFLDLTLQAARADLATPTVFEPGDATVVSLGQGTKVREVTLTDERGGAIRAAVQGGQARLKLPDRPGLYPLTHDAQTEPDKVFAVNPSSRESQLTYRNGSEMVKAWQSPGPSTASPAARPATAVQLTQASIRRQDYWWWLVMAALVALAGESVAVLIRKT